MATHDLETPSSSRSEIEKFLTLILVSEQLCLTNLKKIQDLANIKKTNNNLKEFNELIFVTALIKELEDYIQFKFIQQFYSNKQLEEIELIEERIDDNNKKNEFISNNSKSTLDQQLKKMVLEESARLLNELKSYQKLYSQALLQCNIRIDQLQNSKTQTINLTEIIFQRIISNIAQNNPANINIAVGAENISYDTKDLLNHLSDNFKNKFQDGSLDARNVESYIDDSLRNYYLIEIQKSPQHNQFSEDDKNKAIEAAIIQFKEIFNSDGLSNQYYELLNRNSILDSEIGIEISRKNILENQIAQVNNSIENLTIASQLSSEITQESIKLLQNVLSQSRKNAAEFAETIATLAEISEILPENDISLIADNNLDDDFSFGSPDNNDQLDEPAINTQFASYSEYEVKAPGGPTIEATRPFSPDNNAPSAPPIELDDANRNIQSAPTSESKKPASTTADLFKKMGINSGNIAKNAQPADEKTKTDSLDKKQKEKNRSSNADIRPADQDANRDEYRPGFRR